MRFNPVMFAAIVALSAPALARPQAAAQTTPPASESPDAPRTPLPYDRGYDKPSARTDAINASSRADVAAANDAVLATAPAPGLSVAPADQARYDADMAEYRAALRAQHRAAVADAALAARQERAYADAMTAWRIQVADCRSGIRRACDAPSPRPADFW